MDNKLSRALHYLIYLAQERNWSMGAVKLLKSLVLSDAASLHHRHRSISGAKIVKAPRGPIPDRYDEHLSWLANAGRISIQAGAQLYDPTSYASHVAPDLSCFDAQELEIMTEIGEMCCKKYTAVALSKLTHDYYWEIVGMGEEIPLAALIWTGDVENIPLSDEEVRQLDATHI